MKIESIDRAQRLFDDLKQTKDFIKNAKAVLNNEIIEATFYGSKDEDARIRRKCDLNMNSDQVRKALAGLLEYHENTLKIIESKIEKL